MSRNSVVDYRSQGGGNNWIRTAAELGQFALSVGLTIYSVYQLKDLGVKVYDHFNDKEGQLALERSKKLLSERLGRPDLLDLELDAYEVKLVNDVISPKELGVSFTDIGGMKDELEEVMDNVIMPMQMWRQFGDNASEMMQCPAGVLLYGKPGTGKTMCAKALASESGAVFLNIKASSVVDKWLGESDKLITAAFTLARKLAPTIMFIDELDTIFKKREGGGDTTGAMGTMQGTLLAEWDGLRSGMLHGPPVVVLGATNRPMDLDPAILRRMPVQIKTSLPDDRGRVDILVKQLKAAEPSKGSKGGLKTLSGGQNKPSTGGVDVAGDVDMLELALRTEGFSGSDLQELVRVAVMQRTKRMLQTVREEQELERRAHETEMAKYRKVILSGIAKGKITPPPEMRTVFPQRTPVSQADFEFALTKTGPTGSQANDYVTEMLLDKKKQEQEIWNNMLKKMGKQ